MLLTPHDAESIRNLPPHQKREAIAILEELNRREAEDLSRTHFPYFSETSLRIRTKSGALAPFVLNRPQRYLAEKLDAQLAATGKVRALVLKGRQQGASTYIGGRFYWKVRQTEGVYCFILTHEQKATDNLFNMVDRYWRNDPNKPSASAANAKELTFTGTDSGYAVGTAGSKAVGRSQTIQLFHGSEVAFWTNAKDHFGAVVQTVPNLPGTEIVLESTANGIGGEFHERWQQAEAGIGDYIAIFIPWFWSDEYRREVPPDFTLDEEEETYAVLHSLDLEQMAWRRAKLDELRDPLLFKQEYPATATEAFQTTGHDSFISSETVLNARKAKVEGIGPLIIGADPARFGDDTFALAWRRGRCVSKVERRSKLDAVDGANWIRVIIDEENPVKVFVDAGGNGGPVVDILHSWGHPYSRIVEAVDFGGSPQDPPKVGSDGKPLPGPKNRRAEMWSRSRDWLDEEGGVSIPDDDPLHADACAPGYRYDINQKLLLESKEDIRKRGLRSPDGWDAVALTFTSPVKATDAPSSPSRYLGTKHKKRRTSAWAV